MSTPGTAAWPDPELSVGQKCIQIKRKTVWEAKGPALEKFENEISKQINVLLDAHKEHLETGEPISRTYSFHLWMVGKTVEKAVPTIIITSKSAKLREKVTKLIKKHEVLGDFPGFALNSMDRVPATVMGPQLEETGSENFRLEDGETIGNENVVGVGAAIYARGQPVDVCGTIVFTEDGNETTLGGVIVIADKDKSEGEQYYGFIALHPRPGTAGDSGDSQSIVCRDTELKFDDDSDIASTATASLRQVPSLRSAHDSSSTLDLRSRSTHGNFSLTHLDRKKTSWSSSSRISLAHTTSIVTSTHGVEALDEPYKIGTVVAVSTRSGLHYGIFHIEDPRYKIRNRIPLPMRSPNNRAYMYPEAIAPGVDEGEVWVATGKSGLLRGRMIRNPYFIKLAGTEGCQKMWPIQLEQDIVPGDCGSWAVDIASGNLLGHIVAGDSTLHRAYLIQATDVFEDIQSTMSAAVSLPARQLSGDRSLLPESYAGLIQNITEETSLNSLYPGQHYSTLSEYLNRKPTPKNLNTRRTPNRSSLLAHVILYEFDDYSQKMVQSQFEDSEDYEWCMDARASISPPRLIFLKGVSSPEWLRTLGSQFHIDPEFFHTHLSIMNRKEYFELPAMPSSTKVITLRLTTLGKMFHYKDVETWRAQSDAWMQRYFYKLRDLKSCGTGDSIVRDFSVFEGGLFSIEQNISIYLATTDDNDNNWTVLIWSDVGNSLQQGLSGPWTQPYLPGTISSNCSLLPIIQARPGNGLDIQKRGSFGETSDEPYLSCAQSAAVLPLAYGKLLDRNVMRQDPFYAIHELFAFAAASEQQFLNLVQAKMEDVAKHPFTTATALSELTYFTTILNRHIERLEENVSAIKTRGDTRWPRANDSRIYIADAAADKLLRDFECLTERAKLLSRRCDLFMSYTMSKASLEGSHFAMRQSDSVMLLTVVTLIFLPLTFVSALFSMNVSELLMGSVHLWAYFAVAGPLALLALVAWWATYWSGRKKWTNLFLDRFFHVIKRKQL